MNIGIDARILQKEKHTGIGNYFLKILFFLSENDKENTYFLYSDKKIINDYGLNKNFVIKTPPFADKKIIKGKIMIWLFFWLPLELRKDNVDVFWGPSHILPLKIKKNKTKYVLTVHDIAIYINPKWGAFKNALVQNTFMPWSVKNADLILSDSISTKNDLINYLKINEKKVETVYLGPNDDIINVPDRYKTNVLDKYNICGEFFLYVGTIEPRKNIDTIIKAFDIYCEKNKNNCYLVLVGGLGWKYNKILDTIKKSKYSNRIIMTGYVPKEDKICLYRLSKAMIYPSHYEGFGLPILEAMQCDTIVVTANNSSLPEVGGDAALYIDRENDYIQLSKIMQKIDNFSKKERKAIIDNNKKQLSKFSWEKCANQTIYYIKKTGNNI